MAVSPNAVAPAEVEALRARNVARRQMLLLVIAVAAGAVCRVAQYAADRSFWVDEAALLLNVRSHTLGQLFGHLDYDQAAPPLFMAAERGLLLTLGPSEFSLRLLPLVCGIAALVVFAALARRVLQPPWDVIAVLLFAFSDRFIWHGTEVKQYGIDLFVAVVLTWLAIGPRANVSATKRFVLTALVAAAVVWFSYPAMFVFAAAALALVPRGAGKGAAVVPFLVCSAVAAVSFLVLIATVIHAQQTGGLTAYWTVEFLDLHRPWDWPLWVVRRMHSMANYAVVGAGPVLLIAMAAGVVRMWRDRRFEQLVIIAGPTGLVLLAASAHRYPFDGARLTTFLCPSLIILAVIGLAWGVQAATSSSSRGAILKWIALAPVGYVLILATVSAAIHLVVPRNRGHLRPVLAHVRKSALPGDRIYVLNDRRAFLWYWPEAEGHLAPGSDEPPGTSGGRFWVVWSFSSLSGKRLADPVLKYSRGFAAEKEESYSNGGGAVLFVPEKTPAITASNTDSVYNVPAVK